MTRKGMTLLELLVVIATIGVLMGLGLAAIQRARMSADRLKCCNQMKQIGIALHGYHATHGRLPPRLAVKYPSHLPEGALGWMALILPEMGHDSVYAQAERACRVEPNPLRTPPHDGARLVIPDYVCPSDGRYQPMTDVWGRTSGFASYLGVAGVAQVGNWQIWKGVFGDALGCRLSEIEDGSSQTIMVGERPVPDSLQAGWWYPVFVGSATGVVGPNNFMLVGSSRIVEDPECAGAPAPYRAGQLNNACDRYHFWSLHSGGANFVFGDGSVRFLPYDSSDAVLPALATRRGGEVVEAP
ncbi:MAG: DUF1559 domain-containing protein [Gemmataceae bacterium]